MVILLLPLIQEGLLSVLSESMCTEYRLTKEKSVFRLTDHLDMTIAVDWPGTLNHKPNKIVGLEGEEGD